MPNLEEMCKAFYCRAYQDSTDSANRDPGNIQVNLSNVKISVVGQPKWRTIRRPRSQRESAQKVTVERRSTSEAAYGTLSTSKEFRCHTQVNINPADVIKGVLGRLKLPLDPEYETEIGSDLWIDVSKAKSTSAPIVPVDIHTGQKFQPEASTNVAIVQQEVLDYEGQFECTVRLKGKVIFPLPGGSDQSDLAGALYSLESQSGLVQGMTVNKAEREVHVTLRGKVSFKADNEYINWQQ